MSASLNGSNNNLPAPTSTLQTLIDKFSRQGLNLIDMVALSGIILQIILNCLQSVICLIALNLRCRLLSTENLLQMQVVTPSARLNAQISSRDFTTRTEMNRETWPQTILTMLGSQPRVPDREEIITCSHWILEVPPNSITTTSRTC